MATIKQGDIVRYSEPQDDMEQGFLFVVLEAYDGRAHIKALNVPGFALELAPIETVLVSDIVKA